MRISTTEDDIFNFGRVKLRRLSQNILNAVCGQIVGPRQVERSAERLGQWRPRAGDHDGFSHGTSSGLGITRWQSLSILRAANTNSGNAARPICAVSKMPHV